MRMMVVGIMPLFLAIKSFYVSVAGVGFFNRAHKLIELNL